MSVRGVALGLPIALSVACTPQESDKNDDSTTVLDDYTPGVPDGEGQPEGPSAWSERVDGQTYALDLWSATETAPPELFELMVSEAGLEPLIGVTRTTASSIELLAAVADPGTDRQWDCATTDAFGGSFSSAPDFSVAAEAGGLPLPHFGLGAVPIQDVSLSGSFSDSGDQMLDVSMAASMDMRDASETFGDLLGISDPYEICDLLMSFGTVCDTCDDGEPLCLDIGFDGVGGAAVDIELVAVSPEEADCF